jgi:dolichol-phosphate mannosyltransferase
LNHVSAIVIIPTYNERENLAAIVERVLAIESMRAMIVDDASPDGTGEEADRLRSRYGDRLLVRHRSGPRGLGRSYADGMQMALGTDAALICQMDADFSHDPGDLPRLIEATGSADLVLGSRYVPGGSVHNWPRRRMILSAVANRYVRAITRLPVRDCTSGFRCWRRELLARLPLERILSDGYAFQVELAWEAHTRGARIAEVPIAFVERRQGASKMSATVIAESVLLPWRLALRR